MKIRRALSGTVTAPLVNWPPWSLLNTTGSQSTSAASTQKALSVVLDNARASMQRLS